jgi:FK506-binding nuclear protein
VVGGSSTCFGNSRRRRTRGHSTNIGVIGIRCAAEEVEGARRDSKQKEDDDEAAFEERLAKLQRKATSGTGKKAELRKARKADGTSSSSSGNLSSRGKSKSIMLPPVALQEPVSDGLEVALGFNSYTERLNGRFAGLGLAAMLLVELATGGSFLKYHDISTLGTQLYAMLAAAALFVKYEKEKVSVWPKN